MGVLYNIITIGLPENSAKGWVPFVARAIEIVTKQYDIDNPYVRF